MATREAEEAKGSTDPLGEPALASAETMPAPPDQASGEDFVPTTHTEPAPDDPEISHEDATDRLGLALGDGPRQTLTSLKELAAKQNRPLGLLLAMLGVAAGVGLVLTLHHAHPSAPSAPAASASAAAGWSAEQEEAMLSIPAGSYQVGCDPSGPKSCLDGASPKRAVALDGYRIDRTEVTVAQYHECVNDEACSVDGLTTDALKCNWAGTGRDQHPINCVSWGQAQTYCRWAGGNLPTEAQWEHAARGGDGRVYPWGNETPLCNHAVMATEDGSGCGRDGTWQVGSRPTGKSPTGALDMAGNVREWVSDAAAPTTEGRIAGRLRVVRGGGYQDDAAGQRIDRRRTMAENARAVDVGFRCVRKPE